MIIANDFKTVIQLAHPNAIFPPEKREEVISWLSPSATASTAGEGDGVGVEADGWEGMFLLQDLSISRPSYRLTWGVEVPGDPEHTVYVWLDALTSYLTAAGYPWTAGSESRKAGKDAVVGGSTGLWLADLQIIGKDILRYVLG